MRVPSKSINDYCADRPILTLPSVHQECPVTLNLMTSQVVQRARPLTGHIWPVRSQRVNSHVHFETKTLINNYEDYVEINFSTTKSEKILVLSFSDFFS